MAGEKPKLTLERYFDFLCNLDQRKSFTVDELNQIVFMHGFIKLHRAHKSVVMDALGSLDLMPPTRSTVRDPSSVAPAGSIGLPMSLEEAREDVQALGWQECNLGSVVTVSTRAVGAPPPPDVNLMVTEGAPVSASPVLSRSSRLGMDDGSADEADTVKRRKIVAAADVLLALACPEGR